MGRVRNATVSEPAAFSWAGPKTQEILEVTSRELRGSLTGRDCSFAWDSSVHARVNYSDEDLFFVVRDVDAERNIVDERISHLHEKSVVLPPDSDFEALLVRKERFSFSFRTTDLVTPQISFVRFDIGIYHLCWSRLDWERIRSEVEVVHGVDWNLDIDVVLHVTRRFAEGPLPEEEVIFPGVADNVAILGQPRRLDLDVVSRESGMRLKRLVTVDVHGRKSLEVLDKLVFRTPRSRPRLRLDRDLVESGGTHLKARWNLDSCDWLEVEEKMLRPRGFTWSLAGVKVRLIDVTDDVDSGAGGVEVQSVVAKSDTTTFRQVSVSREYRAELFLFDRESDEALGDPILRSSTVLIPVPVAHATLLPVDGHRMQVLVDLGDASTAGGGSVERTVLRVFGRTSRVDRAETEEMTDEIEVSGASSETMLIDVQPGRDYRVRLDRIAEDGSASPLAPCSAPVFSGRLHSGTTPRVDLAYEASFDHASVRALENPGRTSEHSAGRLVLHFCLHGPHWPVRMWKGQEEFFGASTLPFQRLCDLWFESLLPLIGTCRELVRERVDFKLSMSLSPTLIGMLRDCRIQEALVDHAERRIAEAWIAVEQAERSQDPTLALARRVRDRRLLGREILLSEGLDLTRPLRRLQEEGFLEILTTSATCALLPLHVSLPRAVEAQLRGAVDEYEEVFGRAPIGLWLSEGGYCPGLESSIASAGFRYVVGAPSGLSRADVPLEHPSSGPALIRGTDIVYVAEEAGAWMEGLRPDSGYSADSRYLFSGGCEPQVPTGFNRLREMSLRSGYHADVGTEAAAEHAEHFVSQAGNHFTALYDRCVSKPMALLLVELSGFGGWFESWSFLSFALKKLHFDQTVVELDTVSDVLSWQRSCPVVSPNPATRSASSGFFEGWTSGSVGWMIRLVHDGLREMTRMADEARRHSDRSPLENRILSQASREVLRAESLDFPSSVRAKDQVDRAKALFFHHIESFWTLSSMYWGLADGRPADEITLHELEVGTRLLRTADPLLFAISGGSP